jgi:LysM repeat protein
VGPGDTWLGLAIYYDVSLESLLELNGETDSDYIQEGVDVLIPYPTYTPTPDVTQLPTLQVLEEIQPGQCREHVIAAGETLIRIALDYEVSVQLIKEVNSIVDADLVREGQKLCIPLVTPGPAPSPTFGPSPTPEIEPPHPAPQLLYPPAGVEVPPRSDHIMLQWTVVDLLDSDEYYMVELRNVSHPDTRAVHGFVKTTAWQLPESVRPRADRIETFAWRISVVRGNLDPANEDFRWERSGFPSSWQTFMWMGVAAELAETPNP